MRGYKRDPVDDETLQRVLEAAREAPTAANRQPFRLMVVHTRGNEEQLARIYDRRWFVQAPLVIGVVAVPGEAWRRSDGKPYDEVDATIAMDHLVLAAASLGLGTCWVAAFDPRRLARCSACPTTWSRSPSRRWVIRPKTDAYVPTAVVRAGQVRALVSQGRGGVRVALGSVGPWGVETDDEARVLPAIIAVGLVPCHRLEVRVMPA